MIHYQMRDTAKDMCPLCAYTGSDNTVFNKIMEYVIDNTHHAHLNELVTHVRSDLSEQLQFDDDDA
jgi:hypothetical protein